MLAKIKDFGKFTRRLAGSAHSAAKNARKSEKELILAAIIILTAVASFGLGRLSKIRESREPIKISNASAAILSAQGNAQGSSGSADSMPAANTGAEKLFVASKNGTKYYYPWCGNNIKEENKVWFATKEEAKKAGYTPAKNCKGLE